MARRRISDNSVLAHIFAAIDHNNYLWSIYIQDTGSIHRLFGTMEEAMEACDEKLKVFNYILLSEAQYKTISLLL